MSDKFMKALSKIVQWDPAEFENHESVATIDYDKFVDLIMDKVKADGADVLKREHYHQDHISPITGMLYIHGHIDVKEYNKLAASEKLEWGKVDFPMDKGEEYVKAVQETLKLNHELSLKSSDPVVLKPLPKGVEKSVNSLLATYGISPYQDIVEAFESGDTGVSKDAYEDALAKVAEAQKAADEMSAEAKRLRDELTAQLTKAASVVPTEYVVPSDGKIPEGKVTTKKASAIFKGVKLEQDFEVPFWEWDGPHPDVPAIDSNYIFRPDLLTRVLYALVTNQRAYLQGHTGSGKTTLIEQVAAYLNWPFIRINFDSEISRMDLIGRDTLTVDDGGTTISKFVDGILPKAMSSAYITCFDEIDFTRPDVAYVMQAALEGNGLRITEDGDRLVTPDPMFRMFATGNTVGQGDEHGMYQGARAQSIAFLDRFTVWLRVDYLDTKQREKLIVDKFPTMKPDDVKALTKYTTEHLEAFTNGEVLQPISPRGMLAIAQATVILGSLKTALNMTVLDRASDDDRSTLKGLVDRVV